MTQLVDQRNEALHQPRCLTSSSNLKLTTSSSSSMTSSRKKTIKFAERVKVRMTTHVNDYTDDELKACWYNGDEFKAIRADVRFAAGLVSSGMMNQDTPYHCRRGVECKTRENTARRQQERLNALYAVFDEQDLQTDSCVYDPEYIAHAYKAASAASKTHARAVALRDEREARAT